MISLSEPKVKILAGFIAAICLAAGVYFTFFHSQGFVKTTAAIIDIEEDYSGEDTDYWPTVEYTVDGRTYTGKLDQSSSSYRIGKTITVYYDPDDPAIVHGGSGLGIYLMAASAVILVIIVISGIRERTAGNGRIS